MGKREKMLDNRNRAPVFGLKNSDCELAGCLWPPDKGATGVFSGSGSKVPKVKDKSGIGCLDRDLNRYRKLGFWIRMRINE